MNYIDCNLQHTDASRPLS